MTTTKTKTKLLGQLLFFLVVVGLILSLLDPAKENVPIVSWYGETMGTTYEVKLAGVVLEDEELDALTRAVDAELVAVNEAMSTYLPESEISRFNRGSNTAEWVPISERFQQVMTKSIEVHRATGGAFDPTLGPLIDLWGFGAATPEVTSPTEQEVQAKLEHVGLSRIQFEAGELKKLDPRMEINLSAIAKGYGVDRLVHLLLAEGFEQLYVEIGGEVACVGVNAEGRPWRLGIQVPERDASASLIRVVSLTNQALATSGDYRNFMQDPNLNRHHILDPRTGYPAEHRLASVSVLAADCMTADAVATALYVMGTDEGMVWLESYPGVEALFIDREKGGFEFTATDGFEEALIAIP